MIMYLILCWVAEASGMRPTYIDIQRPQKAIDAISEYCGLTSHEEAAWLLNIGAISQRKKEDVKFAWSKVSPDCMVDSTMQLRIYSTPRRFPACNEYDWEKSLLYISEDCVVVNKPEGLPCMAHPSNDLEHLIPCLRTAIGRKHSCQDLFLTHRLDAATTGAILIARSVAALSYFVSLFENKEKDHSELKKTYAALTTSPVPLGRITHLQHKRSVGAQLLCNSEHNMLPTVSRMMKPMGAWKESVLEVLSCEKVTIEGDDRDFFASSIALITGRKHQIRAQLSALGAPIVNDTLYAPIQGLTFDKMVRFSEVHENHTDKSRLIGSEVDHVQLILQDPRWSQGRSPSGPIGLHAKRLSFIDRSGIFVDIHCPPPWQRNVEGKQ